MSYFNKFLLSLFVVLIGSLPAGAYAQTNEDVVSSRVGYYEGMLSTIIYLDWLFQTAQTIAQKNDAVRAIQHFQMLYWSAGRRPSESTTMKNVVEIFYQEVKRQFDLSPEGQIRNSASPPSLTDDLLGKKSERLALSDRLHSNLQAHSVFGPLSLVIEKLKNSMLEEVADPRMVDRKLESYRVAQTDSFAFSIFYLQSEMYLKELSSTEFDKETVLRISIDRLKEKLAVIASIFQSGPLVRPRIAKVLRDYVQEIELIQWPKQQMSKRLWGIFSKKAEPSDLVTELEKKFGIGPGSLGDRYGRNLVSEAFEEDPASMNAVKPEQRSCLKAHQ